MANITRSNGDKQQQQVTVDNCVFDTVHIVFKLHLKQKDIKDQCDYTTTISFVIRLYICSHFLIICDLGSQKVAVNLFQHVTKRKCERQVIVSFCSNRNPVHVLNTEVNFYLVLHNFYSSLFTSLV